MNAASHLPEIVAASGFVVAFVCGAVAAKTNFCVMGAVSDVVNMGSWGRMRMWLLAMAVAIAGTAALAATGQVDIAKAIYLRPNVPWLSYILGGFLFGVGMTLASGCGNKTLIRIGSGSLKSVVVLLFLAASAYMTIKGLFGVWRVSWLDPVAIDLGARGLPTQGIPSVAASAFGIGANTALVIVAAVVVAAMLAFILADREFRASREQLFGGVVVGLVVVAGWYITGHIGFAENPDTLENTYFATNTHAPESMTFIAPVAYLLELLLLWSDTSRVLTFGIAGVLGVMAGSLAHSLVSRTFRWEGFGGVEDVANHVVGAAMMGFGGITALGCTIGQGLTGVSTLAVGSILALASIIAGSVLAVRYQAWRLDRMT